MSDSSENSGTSNSGAPDMGVFGEMLKLQAEATQAMLDRIMSTTLPPV